MDIRLEAHPHDRRQWRVYLNQYFFQYPSKSAARQMYERVLLSLGQGAAPSAHLPLSERGERRRRARQPV